MIAKSLQWEEYTHLMLDIPTSWPCSNFSLVRCGLVRNILARNNVLILQRALQKQQRESDSAESELATVSQCTSSPGACFRRPRYRVHRVGRVCAARRKKGTCGFVRRREEKRCASCVRCIGSVTVLSDEVQFTTQPLFFDSFRLRLCYTSVPRFPPSQPCSRGYIRRIEYLRLVALLLSLMSQAASVAELSVVSNALEAPLPVFKPCQDSDITLRSMNGEEFLSSKTKLAAASDVFKDMFDTVQTQEESEQTAADTVESAHTLALLLSIIHSPPQMIAPPVTRPKFKVGAPDAYSTPAPPPDIIPFTHLREILYPIADKYQLSPEITEALHSHLAAHSPTLPLETYALASFLNLSEIANNATQYLLTPLLSTLPIERTRIIPSAEAYHVLLQLQTHRVEQLRTVLREEEVFPHGYLFCKAHGETTRRLWDARKNIVLQNINGDTDVPEATSSVKDAVGHCKDCKRGVNSCVEMVRVSHFSLSSSRLFGAQSNLHRST